MVIQPGFNEETVNESDEKEAPKPSVRMPTGPYADYDEENPPSRFGMPAGPLSGSSESEDLSSIGVEEFLKKINISHDSSAEVDVVRDAQRVESRRERLEDLIEEEKRSEHSLEQSRAGLGIPHTKGERLRDLEEAKEKLEEEQKHIELAGQFNDVLDDFGDTTKYSKADIKSIAKTGKTKDGKAVLDKNGHAIHSDIARELAHLYHSGGRKITWGKAREIGKIVDRLLHDFVEIAKGVVRGATQ